MTLSLVIGWTLCIFIMALEAVLLWLILRGKIDLSRLISEPNGDASMSRFQLLIFTFVVALCLFLVVAGSTPNQFPNIPGTVLALLGISASSYTVSKAIQFTSAEGVQERPAEVHVSPASSTIVAGSGKSATFTATVIRSTEDAVRWSVVPPLGQIDQNGRYTPPAASELAQDHAYVQIRASLESNPDVVGVASVILTKGTV